MDEIERAHTRKLRRLAKRRAAAQAALEAAVIEAHQAGLGDRAIARPLGWSHPTVSNLIRRQAAAAEPEA